MPGHYAPPRTRVGASPSPPETAGIVSPRTPGSIEFLPVLVGDRNVLVLLQIQDQLRFGFRDIHIGSREAPNRTDPIPPVLRDDICAFLDQITNRDSRIPIAGDAWRAGALDASTPWPVGIQAQRRAASALYIPPTRGGPVSGGDRT